MRNIFNALRPVIIIAGFLLFAAGLQAQYLVNFEGEGEVKTAYASGTVTLSGLQWDMTEVLIGTSDPDWKNGIRSARLRGYGTSVMKMLQDKANGIGNISFYYRRYGTDQQVDWKVEYSTDGGLTWIQIGNAFTAPASDVVQQFSENVNVDGNVRIRILRATPDGTINRRLNIDDINITNFGGTLPVATPAFNPPSGQYFGSLDVTITCSTPDASIFYTTDGTEPTQSSTPYTDPVNITTTTTLKARAFAEDYDPSLVATGIYTIATVTEVDNLADLRDSYTGGTDFFRVTGEVVLTFKQTFRNQKYIQDATAAILIDDLAGKITTNYNVGDGITGITGSFTEFGNMLQFNPMADPGAPTSTGNVIAPQIITIEEMLANFEDYESELVKINGVTFADAGAQFANGTVYAISDNSKAAGNFRTTFFDVDYIGTAIPSGQGSIVGLLNSRTDGDYITSRSLADLEWYLGEPSNYPTMFAANPMGLSVKLTWEDATGSTLPTGYLILASNENSFTVPADGSPVANDPNLGDGQAAMNVAFGVKEYTFTDLQANETYYFRIYSYTGAGVAIDFKNDGNAPAAEATVVFSIDPEPSNYPTAFSAEGTGSNIKLTWEDATGTVIPAGYLILAGSQNIFQYPVDGTPVADDPNLSDGVGAINIAQGVQQYTFTGLEQQTTYYFQVFPYTNYEQYIDYKTDGQPPLVSGTTQTIQLIDLLVTTFNESWENWSQVSVTGTQVWDRNNTFGVDNTPCARMSGFATQSNENEDWLISPAVNLSSVTNPKLRFFSAVGYTGPAMKVMVSSDYDGQANPNTATWTDLSGQATWPTGDPFWQWTNSGDISLSGFAQQTIRVAFVYYSTSQASATWEADNITVFGEQGNSISDPAKAIRVNIYPNPGHGKFNFEVNEPTSRVEVFSITGQLVYNQAVNDLRFSIDLSGLNKGVYLVKLTDDKSGAFTTSRLIIN